jgi:phosphate starvation-inducible PhoH-like protein
LITIDQVSDVLGLVMGKSNGGLGGAIDVQAARRIAPKTQGQARYIQSIRDHDITFAIGPAGTGKTYLAVAVAVETLKRHQIRKIVLVRPAVEAGESLGFLPGDLAAKINPYLRPLLDALREMIDYDQMKRYMEQEVIEVVPLAYMRGRTLNDAFIILDEAQNTTIAQMKMFLTRMGQGSKMVISGDTTQIDLPRASASGLIDAVARLRDIPGVNIVQMGKGDIVRHRLVQDIVRAYEDEPRQPAKRAK